MTDAALTFGKRLKKHRKDRNMTLREVGERTGMDYVLLNKIETGARLPPPLEGIIRLADALKIKPEEFEELLDLATKDNGKAGARFTSDELRRLKESKTAEVFFTRREREK